MACSRSGGRRVTSADICGSWVKQAGADLEGGERVSKSDFHSWKPSYYPLRLEATSVQQVDVVPKVIYVNATTSSSGTVHAGADLILRPQRSSGHYCVGMYATATNFVWMLGQRDDIRMQSCEANRSTPHPSIEVSGTREPSTLLIREPTTLPHQVCW